MSGRFVRSKIAEQVSEVIGSRQGRAQLAAHGWSQGMPIVIAQPEEKLTDVMSLVAAHQPPAMIATFSARNNDLWFMYVSIDSPVLQQVTPLASDSTIGDLYLAATGLSFLTFRIDQMSTSSLVHAIDPVRVGRFAGYLPGESTTTRGR